VSVIVALASCRGSGTKTFTTTLSSAEGPIAEPRVATPVDVAALVARVRPTVVNITAMQEVRLPAGAVDPFEYFFGRRPRGRSDEVVKRRALGTGFIVDAAGHVVTNAHLVEDANNVRVTLGDERELDAKVRGRDARLDLAVLELEGLRDHPHAALGSSERLLVGEYVVAIGNPFGLGNTVTMGIVSGKGRELGAGPYDDFIQTDASINPGNSGGPLFNMRGEVVGINTAVNPSGQGIGFAIPVDALKDVLPQLLQRGAVSRGRIGISVQELTGPMAKALGLERTKGAVVGEVEPGGPADKAGIRAGDVIVGIDQSSIEHAHDVPRLVARRAPGTRVSLKLIGQNKSARTIDVVLDELRDEPRETKKAVPAPTPGGVGGLGIELANDPHGGAAIRGVAPGSPAAELLEPGEVIVEVNGKAVRGAADAAARIRDAPPTDPVLLRVRHDGHTRFVAIEH
jgi:serine protease Do